MNNAKLWLAVHPTVGVPIFLGAVAVGSFAVHVSVLTNTSWVGDFLSGQPLGTGDRAAIEAPVQAASADGQIVLQPAAYSEDGAREAVLVLPDGRRATVIFKDPAIARTLAPTTQ